MAYFPFFVDLEGKTGLLVGGGRRALEKAQRLLDYGPRLRVAAPEILPELSALPGVELHRRPFAPEDLEEGLAFAVAATDRREVNSQVARLCRERGIPVNVVDCAPECSFLFPALLRRGPLSIGISTGGTSPSAAIYWKERFAQLLPDRMEEILLGLGELREEVKTLPCQRTRRFLFQRLFEECLRLDRPLTREEARAMIDAARGIHPPALSAPPPEWPG